MCWKEYLTDTMIDSKWDAINNGTYDNSITFDLSSISEVKAETIISHLRKQYKVTRIDFCTIRIHSPKSQFSILS